MHITAITVLTLLGFAAAAIYLIVTSTRIRFPKGLHRIIQIDNRMKVHIITADAKPDISFVPAALHACRTAWPDITGRYLYEDVPELALHYSTTVKDGLEGYQTYAKSTIGKRSIPMLVMKEKHVPTAAADPLLSHELGHVLGGVLDRDPDRDHNDPRITRFIQRCAEVYPLFAAQPDETLRS